jgi:endoglucanase
VAIKGDFRELAGGYVMSAGLDDRACLCSIIEAVLNATSLTYDVYVVASAMEETGNGGVRNAVFSVSPDIVIATDVGFARETDIEARCSIECKKGPSVDISALTNRDLSRGIINLAKENGIPCQIVIEPMGTGTNNDILAITGKGAKTVVMSLPLKSMHTSCECVNTLDMEYLSQLLSLIAKTKESDLQ